MERRHTVDVDLEAIKRYESDKHFRFLIAIVRERDERIAELEREIRELRYFTQPLAGYDPTSTKNSDEAIGEWFAANEAEDA